MLSPTPTRALTPSHSVLSHPSSRDLVRVCFCSLAVVVADGHSFERSAIQSWLMRKATNPLTGAKLSHTSLTPSFALRDTIRQWEEQHDRTMPPPASPAPAPAPPPPVSPPATWAADVGAEAASMRNPFVVSPLPPRPRQTRPASSDNPSPAPAPPPSPPADVDALAGAADHSTFAITIPTGVIPGDMFEDYFFDVTTSDPPRWETYVCPEGARPGDRIEYTPADMVSSRLYGPDPIRALEPRDGRVDLSYGSGMEGWRLEICHAKIPADLRAGDVFEAHMGRGLWLAYTAPAEYLIDESRVIEVVAALSPGTQPWRLEAGALGLLRATLAQKLQAAVAGAEASATARDGGGGAPTPEAAARAKCAREYRQGLLDVLRYTLAECDAMALQ